MQFENDEQSSRIIQQILDKHRKKGILIPDRFIHYLETRYSNMLFQKISSVFLSVTVMLSSLTINGLAANTEKNIAPSQEMISSPTDNDSAEYILDLAEDTVDLSVDMEGSIAVGAFTVTGGELDKDFSYSDNVLTVLTDVPLTISNISTTATSDRIAVGTDVSANITLNVVNINVSSFEDSCALKIADDSIGEVNITLLGTNILKSGTNCAGLQKTAQTVRFLLVERW